MKKLSQLSIVYILQVFAVILIFSYPGCFSNANKTEVDTKAYPAGKNVPQYHAEILTADEVAESKINNNNIPFYQLLMFRY